MRIWRVLSDQDYEDTIYKDKMYLDFFNKNFRGEEIKDYNEIIEIETSFKGAKAEKGEVCDILSLGNKLIFTQKVVDLLSDRLSGDVQYIKLKHDVYGYCYAVNVLKVLDCVDEDKSVIQRMPSGKIFRILKYVFKKGITYPCIFKITTNGMAGTFVTDEFVNDIEKNKFTGLKFKLIWEPEHE